MKTAVVRMIQQSLINEGFKPGTVDGQLGDNSYKAVNAALTKRKAALSGDWPAWSNPRKAVAYLQLLCKERKIDAGDIDGFWGPQTDFAADTLTQLLQTGEMPKPWRDETPLNVNPNGWPLQNEAELNTYYGKVGRYRWPCPTPTASPGISRRPSSPTNAMPRSMTAPNACFNGSSTTTAWRRSRSYAWTAGGAA